MHRKNRGNNNVWKTVVAAVIVLAFILPVTTLANNEKLINTSGTMQETYSDGLCPLIYYESKDRDNTPDTLDWMAFGDTFFAYNAYESSGVLKEGPVSFSSDNPGVITLLKQTTSPNFIAGATWAIDTWYGCQYNNGWLWTIDEVSGDMTLIGGGGSGLNGLAYNPVTSLMYGASGTDLYRINMGTGAQTLVGPFNVVGPMIGITFDGEGTLYGLNLNDYLYSINTSTGAAAVIGPLGIDINYAQDMAYDLIWDILYLSAYTIAPVTEGALYTCNITTGHATKVGTFQEKAEITGFAIPYFVILPPNAPERPVGPDEGEVEVEYILSTRTTDPDGYQVYYLWDWGDESQSSWLGPFNSGEPVSARHTWTEIGTYEVRVKAKNIYNRESDWSDLKIIHIIESISPVIKIENVSGGLFKISAEVKNLGGIAATKVTWSITLSGGFILRGKETTGTILSLPAGAKRTISSGPIIGFGNTLVTVTADCVGSSNTIEQEMIVFLFLIRVKQDDLRAESLLVNTMNKEIEKEL